MGETITRKYYSIQFEDGILFVTYIGGPITLEIAKEVVEERLKMTNNQPTPVLVNVVEVEGIDRDARSFFSTDDGTQGLKAGAIVSKSPYYKHLANFFLKIPFSKAKMPAKVFSDQDEAVEWLKQFR